MQFKKKDCEIKALRRNKKIINNNKEYKICLKIKKKK